MANIHQARKDSTSGNTAAEEKRTFDRLAIGEPAAPVVAGGNQGFEIRRKALISPVPHGAIAPTLSTPDAAALAQDAGIDPSKLGGVMILDGKNASDTRSQAEQLAARCNGTVITAPQSKNFTGQVFFVKLPREYAATFKLEMLRISRSSSTTDVALARDESGGITSAITGVLTGTRNTSAVVSSSIAVKPANEIESRKLATVVLEIVGVPPKQ